MENQQRFELLSAYLDQELSPQETKEVEQWLKQDEEAQQTYQQLLQLRYSLRDSPVPASQLPSNLLSETVITKARNQNSRQILLWSSGTMAAVCIAIVTGVFSSLNESSPRFARSNETEISDQSLMIALDQPILEIPTVPASSKGEDPLSTSPTTGR